MAGRITAAMEAAEETTYSLAQKASVPKATLTRKMAGYTAFTIDELERIAAALGVEIASLFEDAA